MGTWVCWSRKLKNDNNVRKENQETAVMSEEARIRSDETWEQRNVAQKNRQSTEKPEIRTSNLSRGRMVRPHFVWLALIYA